MNVELLVQTDGLKHEECRDVVNYLDALYPGEHVIFVSPSAKRNWVSLRGPKVIVDGLYSELVLFLKAHYPHALVEFT